MFTVYFLLHYIFFVSKLLILIFLQIKYKFFISLNIILLYLKYVKFLDCFLVHRSLFLLTRHFLKFVQDKLTCSEFLMTFMAIITFDRTFGHRHFLFIKLKIKNLFWIQWFDFRDTITSLFKLITQTSLGWCVWIIGSNDNISDLWVFLTILLVCVF